MRSERSFVGPCRQTSCRRTRRSGWIFPPATVRVSAKFGSGDEIVAHTNKLVRWVSRSTQALVAFAEKLKTDGLLYETGAHGGAQSS